MRYSCFHCKETRRRAKSDGSVSQSQRVRVGVHLWTYAHFMCQLTWENSSGLTGVWPLSGSLPAEICTRALYLTAAVWCLREKRQQCPSLFTELWSAFYQRRSERTCIRVRTAKLTHMWRWPSVSPTLSLRVLTLPLKRSLFLTPVDRLHTDCFVTWRCAFSYLEPALRCHNGAAERTPGWIFAHPQVKA